MVTAGRLTSVPPPLALRLRSQHKLAEALTKVALSLSPERGGPERNPGLQISLPCLLILSLSLSFSHFNPPDTRSFPIEIQFENTHVDLCVALWGPRLILGREEQPRSLCPAGLGRAGRLATSNVPPGLGCAPRGPRDCRRSRRPGRGPRMHLLECPANLAAELFPAFFHNDFLKLLTRIVPHFSATLPTPRRLRPGCRARGRPPCLERTAPPTGRAPGPLRAAPRGPAPRHLRPPRLAAARARARRPRSANFGEVHTSEGRGSTGPQPARPARSRPASPRAHGPALARLALRNTEQDPSAARRGAARVARYSERGAQPGSEGDSERGAKTGAEQIGRAHV